MTRVSHRLAAVLGFTLLATASFTHAAEDPSSDGSARVCSYTSGLSNFGYASARVSYPCGLPAASYPATTLTGGYTNTKEDMYWLADHLTSHGYIVIAITPNNIYSTPPTWATAHKAGVEELREQNTAYLSAVRGKVDTSRLSVMGFSMGGGGTLLAAGDLGSQIKTAVPLAPWLGTSRPNYSNIRAATLVLAGADDNVAYPSTIASYYQSLPTSIKRGLATFRDATHYDWYFDTYAARQDQTRFKTLITSWLKVYLSGDTSYRTYLDGAEHNRHVADDWFTRYEYRP